LDLFKLSAHRANGVDPFGALARKSGATRSLRHDVGVFNSATFINRFEANARVPLKGATSIKGNKNGLTLSARSGRTILC